jgi:hypothetical protein
MDNNYLDPEESQEELEPLADWVFGLDQRLAAAGSALAERAFSMGCTTSLVPMLIVLAVAFLLGVRHWVSLFLLGLALVLLGGAWSAFVANQANRKAAERAWAESIQAEVLRGLEQRSLGTADFSTQVAGLLPQHSLLYQFVNKMVSLPSDSRQS